MIDIPCFSVKIVSGKRICRSNKFVHASFRALCPRKRREAIMRACFGKRASARCRPGRKKVLATDRVRGELQMHWSGGRSGLQPPARQGPGMLSHQPFRRHSHLHRSPRELLQQTYRQPPQPSISAPQVRHHVRRPGTFSRRAHRRSSSRASCCRSPRRRREELRPSRQHPVRQAARCPVRRRWHLRQRSGTFSALQPAQLPPIGRSPR